LKKNYRPIAFVLASTNLGTLLVNRYDYGRYQDGVEYGVGHQLLNSSAFDQDEVDFVLSLLLTRRRHFGGGVVAIDCGANIGVHTIQWAQLMYGWGEVIAFEAQERIYYALAGNITINNCFNARAVFAAVGAEDGELLVPVPDYFSSSSFGSLELRKKSGNEFIGQEIDYSEAACNRIKMTSIDNLDLARLDFIKIDIEGMEIEALVGAKNSISKFKPQLMIEKIKSNENEILKFLEEFKYQIFPFGVNLVAIHPDDPALEQVKSERGGLQ